MIKVEKLQVNPNVSLKETLNVLAQLELKAIQNREFVNFVLNKFNNNCRACIPKMIWEYVNREFKYFDDLYDEVIQAPYILMITKKGDCDDFALFIKSCLTVLRIPAQYILFGSVPGKFSHIAVYSNKKVIDGVNDVYNVIPEKYKYYLKV